MARQPIAEVLEFHPAANIFPLDDEHLDDLAADIKAHGLRESIRVFEKRILDGRRRWLACQKAGVKPRTEEIETHDPVAYVLSLNLHRRHLSVSQTAMVAARARAIYDEQAKERRKEHGDTAPGRAANTSGKFALSDSGRSRDLVAQAFGIGGRTVDNATLVLKQGAPELAAAVDAGNIAVSTAAHLASLPRQVQAAAVRHVKGRPGARATHARERPPLPEGELQGVGVIRGTEAINCLKRIPKNDRLRKRGFQIVTDWIRHNQ